MKNVLLFLIGGVSYILVELLYRGYSHYSMFIVGGLCFVLIGLLNDGLFSWKMALNSQMTLSTLIITALEFAAGAILNLGFGLDIWDYSDQPYNLYGQICLLYTCFWYLLSLPAILLDDLLRDKWFGEDRELYIIF